MNRILNNFRITSIKTLSRKKVGRRTRSEDCRRKLEVPAARISGSSLPRSKFLPQQVQNANRPSLTFPFCIRSSCREILLQSERFFQTKSRGILEKPSRKSIQPGAEEISACPRPAGRFLSEPRQQLFQQSRAEVKCLRTCLRKPGRQKFHRQLGDGLSSTSLRRGNRQREDLQEISNNSDSTWNGTGDAITQVQPVTEIF